MLASSINFRLTLIEMRKNSYFIIILNSSRPGDANMSSATPEPYLSGVIW